VKFQSLCDDLKKHDPHSVKLELLFLRHRQTLTRQYFVMDDGIQCLEGFEFFL
jgi:hypothetical protein